MDKQQETITVLFADDQTMLVETEDNLQRAIFQLTIITSKAYNIKISSEKIKTIAFKGEYAARSKIVTNGNITKQNNTFKIPQ